MKVTILTLFPDMFEGPFRESILKRAQQKNLLEIGFINIRDFGQGAHKVVDDTAYGGGVGMVMKVDVLDKAIQATKDSRLTGEEQKTVLLDPRGKVYNQTIAKDFSQLQHLILLCGHYEGIDERVRNLVDETISLGDFVVTGGEIPAMLIVDSIVRLIPGVLKPDATNHESFSLLNNFSTSSSPSSQPSPKMREGDQDHVILLEYPQYTNPQEYKGMKVPDILLSGNHKEIEKWRHQQAKNLTKKHRPDLLKY